MLLATNCSVWRELSGTAALSNSKNTVPMMGWRQISGVTVLGTGIGPGAIGTCCIRA